MPRPVAPGRRYVAGLDGIRAIAVLGVIAYHVNLPGAGGGMLGVGVFFTLSGYLITDLLLSYWGRHGTLGLGDFWLRRARRLLPALFLMLAAVSVWVALFDAGQLAAVRRQVVAAALYVSNWSTIEQNGSYFARFAPPLPLDHLWSLAIEEQFYLVLPFVVFLLPRRALAVALLLGIAAAPVLQFFWPGFHAFVNAPWRADTLLSGAMLAFLVRQPAFVASMRARPDLLRALLVALSLGAVLLSAVPEAFGSLKYFWLAGLCATLLLTAYLGTEPWLVRCLESRPLVWFGQVSFAVYLLHQVVSGLVHGYLGHDQPQIRTLADAGFTLLALAITLALAALSYRWIEQPFVRYGHRFRYAPIK